MVMPSWTPPPAQYQPHPGYPQRPPTNGLAIAAMVVSIVGIAGLCVWGPLSLFVCPVGAILGHVSKRRVKETGEDGATMALMGVILGWVGLGLSILLLAAYVAFFWWMSTLPGNPFDPYSDPYS